MGEDPSSGESDIMRALLASCQQKTYMVLRTSLKRLLYLKAALRKRNPVAIVAIIISFSGLFVSLFSLYIYLSHATGKLIISVPPQFEVYFEGVREHSQVAEYAEYEKELPQGTYDLKVIRSGFVSFDGPVLVKGGERIRMTFPFTYVNEFTLTYFDEPISVYVVGFDYNTKLASVEAQSVGEIVEKTVRGSKLKQDKFFVYEPMRIDATSHLYASRNRQKILSSSGSKDDCPSVYQWPDGVYSAQINCVFPSLFEQDEMFTHVPGKIVIIVEKKDNSVTSTGMVVDY